MVVVEQINGLVVELVYTADLKSAAERIAGSSPAKAIILHHEKIVVTLKIKGSRNVNDLRD